MPGLSNQNHIQTQAIILSRIDYGEADRILTVLTPDHGKLRLMAKGVRRIKSKLAGGIELFSISDISFIRGRREIGTLVSTRLLTHYAAITHDINRTMLGYELLKSFAVATEDEPEASYFKLLEQLFIALNDPQIDLPLIRVWFMMQLLLLGGHSPNLHTAINGTKLLVDKQYEFNYDDVAFQERPDGHFSADHIKFLRVGFSGNQPIIMQKITGLSSLLAAVTPLVQTMMQSYIRM